MPRFVFVTQRSGFRSRAIALGIAAFATAALGLLPGTRVSAALVFNGFVEPAGNVVYERLRYVDLAVPDDSRVALRAMTGAARGPTAGAGRSSPVSIPLQPDGPAVEGRAPTPSRDVQPHVSFAPAPPVLYTPRVAVAPRFGRFPGTETFSAHQQDSVLWKLERRVPYAAPVPPSQAERDSLARENAPRWAFARDEKRPVAITMSGGGGISAPLLSPGKSAEQRRRDSAVHAGNLQRLARLADRAKARQDSLRRMDSIAMLTRPRPVVP